jgi:hypothetical protein
MCSAVERRTMQKFLLASILFANLAIPIWASREGNPRRGLKKAVASMLAFDVLYLAALLLIYPRL